MIVINPYLDLKTVVCREQESNVDILAFAANGDELIFAYAFGSTVGITALRAMLSDGDALHFIGGQYGTYEAPPNGYDFHRTNIDGMRKSIGVIVSKRARDLMPEANQTYVMGRMDLATPYDDPETVAAIGSRLSKIVTVGLEPDWYPVIIRAARSETAGEVNLRTTYARGCKFWQIANNPEYWTDLVSRLLKSRRIAISEIGA